MPGANAPAASRGKIKTTRVSPPQVHRFHSGIPRAMVLTVSFALFPAIGLSCRRRLQDHRLTGLISASRYQNHTTSPSAYRCVRLTHPKRPSHPAPNVRDDRETPLLIRRRTREEEPLICPSTQAHIFAIKAGRPDQLEWIFEFAFLAQPIKTAIAWISHLML
jgi:hypothetical protein